MKITELRLAKLFLTKAEVSPTSRQSPISVCKTVGGTFISFYDTFFGLKYETLLVKLWLCSLDVCFPYIYMLHKLLRVSCLFYSILRYLPVVFLCFSVLSVILGDLM